MIKIDCSNCKEFKTCPDVRKVKAQGCDDHVAINQKIATMKAHQTIGFKQSRQKAEKLVDDLLKEM